MDQDKDERRSEWNEKYWDIIYNLYWTPRYLGLKSIPRKQWKIDDGRVSVSLAEIANTSGPLYSRLLKSDNLKDYLGCKEEILNHFFNLAFAIAGDEATSRLLCAPLGIDDAGPFQSMGRELQSRYGWSPNENVTQPDGFFISQNSAFEVVPVSETGG